MKQEQEHKGVHFLEFVLEKKSFCQHCDFLLSISTRHFNPDIST